MNISVSYSDPTNFHNLGFDRQRPREGPGGFCAPEDNGIAVCLLPGTEISFAEGAAIGREFSHSLLAAVAGKPDAEIQPMLDRLIAAALLFKQGEPPHATYLFKHALVQDAAYGTLLRSSRQHLHERIARILEEEFPEAIEIQPELLARHCAEAGLEKHAIRYWRLAGEKAVHRASNREAIRHFRQALALIEKQPRTADRLIAELPQRSTAR